MYKLFEVVVEVVCGDGVGVYDGGGGGCVGDGGGFEVVVID